MGYYSSVAIVLWQPDYEDLAKAFSDKFKEPIENWFCKTGKLETPDETYVCLYNSDTMWYEYFPQVKEIMAFLKDRRHSYCRIGEKAGDVENNCISDDERGTDEEFLYFLSPNASISGIDRFGISTATKYILVCTSSDSGYRRKTKDGEDGFFETAFQIFDSRYERDHSAYDVYKNEWDAFVTNEDGTDENGNQILSLEEFSREADNCGSVCIQLADNHITYEFYEQAI